MQVRFFLFGFVFGAAFVLSVVLWNRAPEKTVVAPLVVPPLDFDWRFLSIPPAADSAGRDSVHEYRAPLPDPVESDDVVGRIVYVQDGDLWVKGGAAPGAQRLTQLGDCSHPEWSYSGEWISYRSRGGFEVRVIRADGSRDRVVMSGTTENPAYGWSPAADLLALGLADGRVVLFDPEREQFDVLFDSKPEDTPDENWNDIESIEWSPDGERIAVTWMDVPAIWTISGDGTDARRVYAFQYRRDAQGGKIPGPVLLAGWTGDGRHILFWQAAYTAAAVLADGVPLYAVPADGGARMQVVDQMLIYPDFMQAVPGGSILAVTQGSSRLTSENKRIVLWDSWSGIAMDLTGGDDVAFCPSWSPDGEWLVYIAQPEFPWSRLDDCCEATVGRRVWVVDRAGSEKHRLTDDDQYGDDRPVWSRDGRCILFARIRCDDRVSLWQMRPDGSDLRCVVARLTPKPNFYYGHTSWEEVLDWWSPPEDAMDPASRPAGRVLGVTDPNLAVTRPATIIETRESR